MAAIANMMKAASPQGVKMYQCGKTPEYWFCAATIAGNESEPAIITTETAESSKTTS